MSSGVMPRVSLVSHTAVVLSSAECRRWRTGTSAPLVTSPMMPCQLRLAVSSCRWLQQPPLRPHSSSLHRLHGVSSCPSWSCCHWRSCLAAPAQTAAVHQTSHTHTEHVVQPPANRQHNTAVSNTTSHNHQPFYRLGQRKTWHFTFVHIFAKF